MENFDVKAWMKANKQGPYKMFESFEGKKKRLNEGYVDLKPVNEADSMIFDKGWQYEDNDWMQDVDGTEAYKVGEWTCYYEDNLGALEWTYKDDDPYGVVVYATPNFHDDGKTPIEVSREGEILANYEIDQAFFDSFEEYAKAVRPYLEDIQRGFDIEDSLRGSVNEADSMIFDKGWQYDDEEDLFQNQESLPAEVQDVLDAYSDSDGDYRDLEAMLGELEALGYTFEYGLDGVPYDLRKMDQDLEELEKPENIYSGEEDDSVPYDRIMDLGGDQIEQGIISLMDDMFDPKDILELVKELLKNRVEMEKNYGKL